MRVMIIAHGATSGLKTRDRAGANCHTVRVQGWPYVPVVEGQPAVRKGVKCASLKI